MQAGTALFSLVSPNVWVVANFKESQLERMKPGDKVTVSVDAWPDMALEGHVDSIQQGSGSRFSAFPRAFFYASAAASAFFASPSSSF